MCVWLLFMLVAYFLLFFFEVVLRLAVAEPHQDTTELRQWLEWLQAILEHQCMVHRLRFMMEAEHLIMVDRHHLTSLDPWLLADLVLGIQQIQTLLWGELNVS